MHRIHILYSLETSRQSILGVTGWVANELDNTTQIKT